MNIFIILLFHIISDFSIFTVKGIFMKASPSLKIEKKVGVPL